MIKNISFKLCFQLIIVIYINNSFLKHINLKTLIVIEASI